MNTMLSLQTVAERADVAVKTVRREIERGHLPAYRIGAQIRVREDDLEAYLAGRSVKAVSA